MALMLEAGELEFLSSKLINLQLYTAVHMGSSQKSELKGGGGTLQERKDWIESQWSASQGPLTSPYRVMICVGTRHGSCVSFNFQSQSRSQNQKNVKG
jgi:hypothetical protein